jgi:hypothetical protein
MNNGPSSGATAGARGGAHKSTDPDDPFEMLQELITDGSLIKEAVRRLQMGLNNYAQATKANNNAATKTFYDSEDDDCGNRTPPTSQFPDHLCCEVVGI